MRKIVFASGWLLWLPGLLYATLGVVNGEKVVAKIRDSTFHSNQLHWEDGKIRKEEARMAMFQLSDRFADFNRRVYLTLAGLMSVGTILILVGRKKPSQQLR